jgi:1-acyl-sn-glycerol-3-phosphate acyltransferase
MQAVVSFLTPTQLLSRWLLRLLGWRVDAKFPSSRKFVMIAAPHTATRDFFLALLFKGATRLKPRFVAKDSLFVFPLGSLMRWLGAFPVDRQGKRGFVAQVVTEFERHESWVVVIAPEGSRSKVPYWKTGFYYIALGAKVPVALAFMDYQRKLIGVDPGFYPSGDLPADFQLIRDFYSGIQGKYPQRQGEIQLKPDDGALMLLE